MHEAQTSSIAKDKMEVRAMPLGGASLAHGTSTRDPIVVQNII